MIPPFPFVAIGMAGSDSVCLPTSGKSGELSWPYQVGNNLGPKSLLVGIYHSPRQKRLLRDGDSLMMFVRTGLIVSIMVVILAN